MPDRLPMAFKGGTSLSKAFRVIDRFSEDIDITIDYKAFNCDDPFTGGVSKTKIKNIGLQLRSMVTHHINKKLVPYFEKIISEQFKDNFPTIKLDDDGETLHLYYPSAIAQKNLKLLNDVIKVKKIFYDSGFAKYDDCLNGNLRLIPNEDHLKLLKDDFSKMLDNKMFYGHQPNFDNIISEIKKLENSINEK